MTLALEGLKVIDVSQVAAVPMAARHLGDFGADVVHVENPASGDSWRYYQNGQGPGNNGVRSSINYNWENFNRNKRSMTLDLSRKEGQDIMHRMVQQADVFMTNLRTFEKEDFRLTYETLERINPRIIYASLSGYGTQGPDKDMGAYDVTAYWTRSGVCDLLTVPSFPHPAFRPAMGDTIAALALAYGVMTALFVRDKTGVGQEIHVALMHTGLYQMSFDVAGALVTGLEPKEWREQPPPELAEKVMAGVMPAMAYMKTRVMNPLAAGYYTRDRQFLLLMMLQPDRYWERVCRAIQRPDLISDPRFTTFDARAENRAALFEILDKVFAAKTLAEWEPLLTDIPHAPFRTIKDAINDPQSQANGFFVTYDHPSYGKIRMVANPVNMSKTPPSVRLPAPEFGQHTEEVLLDYGYTWEDITRFKDNRTIV